jgi:hypothetical protein
MKWMSENDHYFPALIWLTTICCVMVLMWNPLYGIKLKYSIFGLVFKLNNITLCLNCQLSDANKRVTSLIEKVDNNTMSTEKVKPSTDHRIRTVLCNIRSSYLINQYLSSLYIWSVRCIVLGSQFPGNEISFAAKVQVYYFFCGWLLNVCTVSK